MNADELLDQVIDLKSFIAYAEALAEERREAERIEAGNQYLCPAPGWNNMAISEFIDAGLSHFDPAPDGTVVECPTWKDLAMFLYYGKIIG